MMDDAARSLSFAQVSVPEGYERFMLCQLFEPWAAVLVDRAGIEPGSRVLDVASGLGPVAQAHGSPPNRAANLSVLGAGGHIEHGGTCHGQCGA